MTPEQSVIAAILICIAGAVLTLAGLAQQDRRGLARVRLHGGNGGGDYLGGCPRAHLRPGAPAGVPYHSADRLGAASLCGRPDGRVPPAGGADFRARRALFHRLYAELRGLQRGALLSLFPALPGRDVWPGQHDRHDVVLLHLLADDDPAGLCAHPVRAQEPRQRPRGQQVSHHDADRLRGDDGRRRVAGRDRRGGQRQRELEV